MDIQRIEEIIAQAKASFEAKDYKKAIIGFEAAHLHFTETQDELNAAEMANNLSVSFLQTGKKAQALDVVEGTDLIFEKHNDQFRQAMSLGNYAAALESMKRYEEAGLAYQKSADLFEQLGETEFRTHVLKSLATLQIRQGKQLESILSMQQSLSAKKNLSVKDRILNFLLKIPFRLSSK